MSWNSVWMGELGGCMSWGLRQEIWSQWFSFTQLCRTIKGHSSWESYQTPKTQLELKMRPTLIDWVVSPDDNGVSTCDSYLLWHYVCGFCTWDSVPTNKLSRSICSSVIQWSENITQTSCTPAAFKIAAHCSDCVVRQTTHVCQSSWRTHLSHASWRSISAGALIEINVSLSVSTTYHARFY